MALGAETVVDTADFEVAAALFFRAQGSVSSLPRIVTGVHDTHAGGLDFALDEFARQAVVAANVLSARLGWTGVLAQLAAHGFTSVEQGLARALAP